jgi:hypothetical protein
VERNGLRRRNLVVREKGGHRILSKKKKEEIKRRGERLK